MSWAGTRFDGRSAAGETVLVRIDGDALWVLSRAAVARVPLADVSMPEAFERAPRMVHLPGGATLEIPDPDRTFVAALAGSGVRESWVVRLQRAWAAVAVAVLALVAGGVYAYVEGLPVAADWIARAVPPSVESRLGDRLLAMLDRHTLAPSRLPAERQRALANRFEEAAAVAAPGVATRVLFRRGAVNAFALPGGTIVLMDELVALAEDDAGVMGVLGHELGHVAGRHSMRQLLQAVGVGVIAGLLWGDFSTVAANVPVVLGMMRYGRAFEDEADVFAVTFLQRNHLPVQPLIDFFIRVQGHDAKRRRADVPEFLSTHPGTDARIERLRRALEAEAERSD